MERPSFSIRSSSSERELAFVDPAQDAFTVVYRSNSVHASCGVYEYLPSDGVATFLRHLASFERPWTGAEQWRSLEGTFSLSARCSPLGVVMFEAELTGTPGAAEEWRLVVELTAELGQLPGLAQRAARFFRTDG